MTGAHSSAATMRQFSSPTAVILKLALGETPEAMPTVRDVVRRTQVAAQSIDGNGPIDRITAELAGEFRAARLFPAAAHPPSPGATHIGYDAIEHTTGIARTLMLRVPAGTPTERLCDALAQVTSVEGVSLNYITQTPFDAGDSPPLPDSADGGWDARRMVRMPEALAHEPGDDGVTVGLIDSGINARHPEFARTFRTGFDTVRLDSGDVAAGIELLGDHLAMDIRPVDLFVGHGMGCAGIIAANGKAMPRGLGGECRILPMRALAAARMPNAKVVGIGAISDLDLALKLAVDLGAKIINLSFGTDDDAIAPHSPKPHAESVAYAIARGCILIAASGNNGRETRYWPAAFPEVIAVGAVSESRLPAGFSTRGDHVALCAPGQKVLTSGLDGYQLASGTSFAAPFVSGAAALLVARSHRRAHPIDAATIRRVLVATAQPFASVGISGCGTGILDAAAALEALDREIDASPGYSAASDADGGADDG
ncbi:MAG TPA: S8 family serine peptidase [Novosphingobium sp.]|nr:S8 family serine peptidase [Novosphingobium sp.]